MIMNSTNDQIKHLTATDDKTPVMRSIPRGANHHHFWIASKPNTLQVINKNRIKYCSYCGKSSCNGNCS